MSRVDTSKRRSVDTSIRRYIDTSIHRYVDTSIRRYVVHMFAARPCTRTSGQRSGGTPSNVDRLTTRFLNFSDGRDARPRANIIAIACVASPVDKRDRSNEPITVNLPSKRGAQVEGAASRCERRAQARSRRFARSATKRIADGGATGVPASDRWSPTAPSFACAFKARALRTQSKQARRRAERATASRARGHRRERRARAPFSDAEPTTSRRSRALFPSPAARYAAREAASPDSRPSAARRAVRARSHGPSPHGRMTKDSGMIDPHDAPRPTSGAPTIHSDRITQFASPIRRRAPH